MAFFNALIRGCAANPIRERHTAGLAEKTGVGLSSVQQLNLSEYFNPDRLSGHRLELNIQGA